MKSGAMYVYNRAYVDLALWMTIIRHESHFVTRLKRAPRKKAVHEYVLKPEDFDKAGVLWEGEWTPSEAACYRNSIKPRELKLRLSESGVPADCRWHASSTEDYAA
ncbi:MAG: hypothetical protein AB7P49_17590 [Bdellovibrionales bacterium]